MTSLGYYVQPMFCKCMHPYTLRRMGVKIKRNWKKVFLIRQRRLYEEQKFSKKKKISILQTFFVAFLLCLEYIVVHSEDFCFNLSFQTSSFMSPCNPIQSQSSGKCSMLAGFIEKSSKCFLSNCQPEEYHAPLSPHHHLTHPNETYLRDISQVSAFSV